MGKTPKTRTKETDLAKAQAQILQSREEFANQFFFPQLKADLATNQVGLLSPKYTDMAIGAVSPEIKAGTDQGLRSLAMRGATGGVQAAGLASLDVAKQMQFGQARLAGEQMAQQVRGNTLSTLASLTPSPTTAAPYVTESR
jgi:hypothetical protein